MLDIYNTLTAVFAFLILFVVNSNIFTINDDKRQGLKEYKWFILSIFCYLIADASWGIVHGFIGDTRYIFIDAAVYNVAMIFTVYMCCRYISKFLEQQNKKGRFLYIFGTGFLVVDILFVIANFFYPVLFWIDDFGTYHTGLGREIGMFVLVAVFILMAITAFINTMQSTDIIRGKMMSIFFFATFITISLFTQAFFPEYPCYSLGLVTGVIIIFVQIDVAEQSEQLAEITTLNNNLKESNEKIEKNTLELVRMKNMLEASNIGTWELISQPGCAVKMRADKKMKELLGVPADINITEEELAAMHRSRIIKEDLPLFKEYDANLLSGRHVEITYRWNHPTLGERYVRCGGIRVSDFYSEKIIISGYHYDITEITRLEKELEETAATSEAKTKYLQNMSHEIRTPLNAMFGFSQLLGMPDGTWTDEDKDKYNKIIYNTFYMLDMLINDILDSADAKHGNYRMELGEMAVNEVCQNAMMCVEFRRPGNVDMRFTTDLDDEHTITSDSRRIQQILINYLTNACKNTARGEIHLHVTDKEKPGKLVFSVTDTGKGVPEEKAELIFGRYTKLDQKVQGSGLGLNICHIIATKLNAKVYLDTTYKEGSRFKLEVEDKIFEPDEQ